MSDPVDAAKAVAREIPLRDVYVDAIQPGARQVGHTVELVGRAINVALAPVEFLIFKGEEIRARLLPDLEKKLADIPPDHIQTPAPEIAGPILEALRFSVGNDELRDMYASLLATAMDSSTATGAHPAFVEIIKQLTSDEARIISKLAQDLPDRYSAVVSVERLSNGGREKRTILDRLVEGACEIVQHEHLVPQYVGNLIRLGIVENVDGLIPDDNPYLALEGHALVQTAVAAIEAEDDDDVVARIVRGALSTTPFGIQFCSACVRA